MIDKTKVVVEIHYYDCKGRQYRLDNLAQQIRNMGMEIKGTGFESDYDGYVEVIVTREQIATLYNKYPKYFHATGADWGGYTDVPEEMFDNIIKFEEYVDTMLNRKK